MSSVSVVVCTRGRPAMLAVALAALREAVAAVPGTEVVIVQQGEGEAEQTAAAAGLDATVVHDGGVGAARARNIGIRHARGEVVMFTDDDCEVPPSWLTGHLDALTDERVTATFGVVDGLPRGPGTDPVAERREYEGYAVPWMIGHSSNMAVRRAAIVAVGGFDERLGPGARHALIGEDADLIIRLLESGAVCLSGVGEPVKHMGWRTAADDRVVLRRYEAGSGAWIGAALRRRGMVARPYLRSRVHLVRVRVGEDLRRRDIGAGIGGVVSLVRGLAYGLTFKPWPAPLSEAGSAPGGTPPREPPPPGPR